MAKKTTPQDNDTHEPEKKAINVRDVETDVWKEFKKLAMIHDMSIQDYLKHLVVQEKKRVSISIK